MKTVLRRLRQLFAAKWCWKKPKQSAVLIFDASGQERLMPYLEGWRPETLYVGLERINLFALFLSLFRIGEFSTAYFDCFIELVRPRLIVTFIDNNPNFYTLSSRHPYAKTMFVQNAIRSYYVDVFEVLDKSGAARNKLKVDYMMTLGHRVGEEYAKYIEGKIIPIGSLRNNIVPIKPGKTSGTIAFNSQFRNTAGFLVNNRFCTFEEFFEKTDRIVLSCLKKYAERHGKQLIIVTCSPRGSDNILEKEKAYYKSLLGDGCSFSEWTWHGSSYEAADKSEVYVSIDSSMGYESAVRGNKTAIFSIRGGLLGISGATFSWPATYPDEGPFWTNLPDPEAFERILDHLFAIDQSQWREELRMQNFDDIIAYDPGNGILKSVLQKELGSTSTTPY
jgi:surface carbohydrate biosynthesis protein